MSELKLQDQVKYLLDVNGVDKVLKIIAEDLTQREIVIEENHNQTLSCAFEWLFQSVMQLLPQGKKKDRQVIEILLKAPIMKDALDIIKVEHPSHSPATKKALKAWKDL